MHAALSLLIMEERAPPSAPQARTHAHARRCQACTACTACMRPKPCWSALLWRGKETCRPAVLLVTTPIARLACFPGASWGQKLLSPLQVQAVHTLAPQTTAGRASLEQERLELQPLILLALKTLLICRQASARLYAACYLHVPMR
jgi:hypothetical protein